MYCRGDSWSDNLFPTLQLGSCGWSDAPNGFFRIYTPPALRGRGFAKAVVAASLLVARDRGSSRAVLFTNNPSAARAYEALGFRRIGDYSLVLLR